MEKPPQFKTGIRHRQENSVLPSRFASGIEPRMLVHVEHAPDFVVQEVVIALTSGFLLAFSLARTACSTRRSGSPCSEEMSISIRAFRRYRLQSRKYSGSVTWPSHR